MQVNSSWNYKESLFYINYIKSSYVNIMLSFSIFGDNLELLEKIRKLKKSIYSLRFEEWKKDKLWEYINDDIEYIDLWRFI